MQPLTERVCRTKCILQQSPHEDRRRPAHRDGANGTIEERLIDILLREGGSDMTRIRLSSHGSCRMSWPKQGDGSSPPTQTALPDWLKEAECKHFAQDVHVRWRGLSVACPARTWRALSQENRFRVQTAKSARFGILCRVSLEWLLIAFLCSCLKYSCERKLFCQAWHSFT